MFTKSTEPIRGKSSKTSHLVSVTARFDILGAWERDLPNGSRRITTYELALDGRYVFRKNLKINPDGSSEETEASAMWWNATSGKICFHYLDNTDASVMGKLVSLIVDGDTVIMLSRHTGTTGNGIGITATITRIPKGDAVETSFNDFSRADRQESPNEAAGTRTAKLTRRNGSSRLHLILSSTG